ncbi:AGE family epimerase/isomerase [Acidisoma cellulosilytica]|uniref:AGE family epimerase/isomerase n=1 Tax=Acidisoma cellulosilyticum TaxID=2802395 RepID=A0A963YYI8_9PROT|nr:AGE family epimerase/isomerase [Acidisoma cellulosilyticum]MCB8878600.1 AGE family epimerase/isomerase [Acidisoma cellulosilyticum]
MSPSPSAHAAETSGWTGRPNHRRWLQAQADALLRQFQFVSIDKAGGFFDLDIAGQPRRETQIRELVTTTRVTHCFAIAHMMGWPGADALVRHGLTALWDLHRDAVHGGYRWQAGPGADDSKQAYGHAFVLLAASTAKMAGFAEADAILADVTQVLNQHFWESDPGATAEEFAADWSPISNYRGQNANMHLTEALMAAFEATGERDYLSKAESIADLIINRLARAHAWHVIEHFDSVWRPDFNYRGSDMFRPQGTTPGHALEWSRLIAQLHILGGRHKSWMPEAAAGLFRQAVTDGWDRATGGFYYTLDYANAPLIRDRLWWPCCEGAAAAAFLGQISGDAFYEGWYRQIWDWSAQRLADPVHGGWNPELDDSLTPRPRFFTGKPDIYHLLQSFLIPLYPAEGSLGEMVRRLG